MSSGFGPMRRLVSLVSLERDSIDSVAAYTLGWLQRRTRDRSFEACREDSGGKHEAGTQTDAQLAANRLAQPQRALCVLMAVI
jgi:hypothetical protein